MKDDITLYPVSSIETGVVQDQQIVLLKLDFLTHAMQTPGESHAGRTYALQPIAARELIRQIQARLLTLESALPPDGGGPRH